MTKAEVEKTTKAVSTILGIEAPKVEFGEYWKGVYLEAGLFQGWDYVVFNPNYIETADIYSVLITIAHEVRHTYQMIQIRNLIQGLPYDPRAEEWNRDCVNGKGDTFEDSKEVDSVIFSYFLISGLTDTGFDIPKMTDAAKMRQVFDGMKLEKWYKPKYDKIIFYEKDEEVYIGDKSLLPKSLAN